MLGVQSTLQGNSDFMNKIEANDLILVSSHVSLEIKIFVEKNKCFGKQSILCNSHSGIPYVPFSCVIQQIEQSY